MSQPGKMSPRTTPPASPRPSRLSGSRAPAPTGTVRGFNPDDADGFRRLSEIVLQLSTLDEVNKMMKEVLGSRPRPTEGLRKLFMLLRARRTAVATPPLQPSEEPPLAKSKRSTVEAPPPISSVSAEALAPIDLTTIDLKTPDGRAALERLIPRLETQDDATKVIALIKTKGSAREAMGLLRMALARRDALAALPVARPVPLTQDRSDEGETSLAVDALHGYDPNTPEGVDKLTALVPELKNATEALAMRDAVINKAQEARSFPIQTLLNAIAVRRDTLSGNPPPDPIPISDSPSWDELGDYAAKLPQRHKGHRPYPVDVHVRQRIGDLQRNERPQIPVRRIVNGNITYAPINKNNFADVLRNALVSRPRLLPEDASKIEVLAREWKDFPVDTKRREEMVRDWKGRVKGETDVKPSEDDVTKVVTGVCEALLKWVEPEVLATIGLPEIVFEGAAGVSKRQREPAWYEAKTRQIHIQKDTFTVERLLHEFGHHIEEQGPMEVWLGLAAYLNRLNADKPLTDYLGYLAPQYYFDWSTGAKPRLPNPAYAITYYEDAATELIALGLEQKVPAKLHKLTNRDSADTWHDPEYVALVMEAVRPKAMRKAGVTFPTLL